MSPSDWKSKPPLLKRADLRDAGFKDYVIDDLRFPVDTATAPVPVGRIGALRGLSGMRAKRKGEGNWTYLKWTVSRLLGPKYADD